MGDSPHHVHHEHHHGVHGHHHHHQNHHHNSSGAQEDRDGKLKARRERDSETFPHDIMESPHRHGAVSPRPSYHKSEHHRHHQPSSPGAHASHESEDRAHQKKDGDHIHHHHHSANELDSFDALSRRIQEERKLARHSHFSSVTPKSRFQPQAQVVESEYGVDDDKDRQIQQMQAQINDLTELVQRNRKPSIFRAHKWKIILILLLLIVGVLVAYISTDGFQSLSSDKAAVTGESPTTSSPSVSWRVSGDTDPPETMPPSSAPTQGLNFDPPLIDDCLAIARGEPVSGQDKMTQRGYEVILEMTLNREIEESVLYSVLEDLQAQVQDVMIPILVGCSSVAGQADRNEAESGHFNIRHLEITGPMDELPTGSQRRLYRNLDRFAIGNGDTLFVTPVGHETCSDDNDINSGQKCYVVSVPLNLYLKSPVVKYLTISGLIFDAFQGDLVVIMRLELQITKLTLRGVNNNTPTKEPSTSPSEYPSANPTIMASEPPSEKPTGMPVTGSPTKHPTTPPSPAPTPSPTHTTTLLPTPAPSATPSSSSAGSPTLLPTPRPNPVPTTRQPSTQPSISPTVSLSPTPMPSVSSTVSLSPTPIPTSPTKYPTPSPTSGWTIPPTTVSTPPPTPTGLPPCILVDSGGGFRSIPMTQACWVQRAEHISSTNICANVSGAFDFSGGVLEMWGSGYRFGNFASLYNASEDKLLYFDFADSVTHYKWMATKTTSCGTLYAGYGATMDLNAPHPWFFCDPDWRSNYQSNPVFNIGHAGTFSSGWSYLGSYVAPFEQWHYTTIIFTGTKFTSATTCLDHYDCSDPVYISTRDFQTDETVASMSMGIFDNYCGADIGIKIGDLNTTAIPIT